MVVWKFEVERERDFHKIVALIEIQVVELVLIVLEEVQVSACTVVAESIHTDYFFLGRPQALFTGFSRVIRTLVLILVPLRTICALLASWALLQGVIEGTPGVFL